MKATRRLEPGDDLFMLENPENWPAWPVLPLKRYNKKNPGSFPDLGIVLAVEGVPRFTVYEVDMFLQPEMKDLLTSPDIVKHEYKSFDEMLVAGWVVD